LRKYEVFSESYEVNSKLSLLELEKEDLVEVAYAAYNARANTTDNHPVNSPGTLSYHAGVFQLRESQVGGNWKRARVDGVECIENSSLKVRVGFCNVHQAASLEVDPIPVTSKGEVTIRNCVANLQQSSFDFGEEYEAQLDEFLTYYLFVGEDGSAELSLPLACPSGKFDELVERIFILTPDEIENDPMDDFDDDDGPEIEINISRKT